MKKRTLLIAMEVETTATAEETRRAFDTKMTLTKGDVAVTWEAKQVLVAVVDATKPKAKKAGGGS